MHLLITDSGLGGVAVCARIERLLRARGAGARITYFNAWPDEGRGYNDLPDMAARARQFDRALDRMAALAPDRILIACNTLSIVYEHTAFRSAPPVPVRGIVEAGVKLFAAALADSPRSAIVLLGTRTTIESGVHRERLLARGVDAGRVGAAACHGLAAAIERGPDSTETAMRIESCAEAAAAASPAGEPLFAGLCCTHYGMVGERIAASLARRDGRAVTPLDPNATLAAEVAAEIAAGRPAPGPIDVTVLSKVTLTAEQRNAVAALFDREAPVSAAALRRYRHEPDLFENEELRIKN